MESESVFVPHYCPNCGTEVGEKDICQRCNKDVVFTANEFNNLEKKHCHACGRPIKPNSNICNNCGNEMQITQSTIYIQKGRELFNEGKKEEAIAEAKKALAVENTPEGRFMICGVIISSQGDLLKEKYLTKYGNIDYFPKEVIESEEFQDMLKYGKQALEELNKCTPDIRRRIESDPKNNVDGIKHTVKELSEAVNNPNPSSPYKASEKKGGCFIATACYGTDTAPDVLTLRVFRDRVLLSSKTGRSLVKFYYLLSPPVAKIIASHYILRLLVRQFFVQPIAGFCRSKLKRGKS